jgi:predicted RNase H-like HicB family nuclease
MTKTKTTIADTGKTTYTYRVVVEPDEDAWHARCPALQGYGAATWGRTRAEALRHIREVVAMVAAELIEDGETSLWASARIPSRSAFAERRAPFTRICSPIWSFGSTRLRAPGHRRAACPAPT